MSAASKVAFSLSGPQASAVAVALPPAETVSICTFVLVKKEKEAN